MSRNFEMLNESGRISDNVEAQPEVLQPVILADRGLCTLSSSLESPAREELTKLVHTLFLPPNLPGPRQVVFAGTEAGVGCTWICAHAGEILATQTGRSVCIVDSNFRSPGLHERFGLRNEEGLADAISRSVPVRQFVLPLSAPNFWLLSSGSPTPRCEKLQSSAGMGSCLANLRAEFDYVLLDTAPVNAFRDAIILGGLSDGVVVILKAHSSRRDTARKVLKEIHSAGVSALGVVLNQRTFPIPEAINTRL